MKIAVAQFNPVVGDLAGNVKRLLDQAHEAAARGAGLMVTPELALCGYPPEDLLFRPDFRRACMKALDDLARRLPDIAVLVGHPLPERQTDGRERLFNAASLLAGGKVQAVYRKQRLPNYEVFDEVRYFDCGDAPLVFSHQGVKIGVVICEDAWHTEPVASARAAGAGMIVVLNASPFDFRKRELRHEVVKRRVAECGLPLLYVQMTGGQDELVFDGASFAVNRDGETGYQAREFAETLDLVSFAAGRFAGDIHPALPEEASIYAALKLALKDYVDKNGFPGVLVGLSGGVDSALVLAIAVDALGPKRVRAVMMPSAYTAQMSLDDAREMAALHGIEYNEINITPLVERFSEALSPLFAGRQVDATEENIQARVRGTLLMALSNKFGSIVVTTGNKSEMAVGYATLYGDMAGGYALLKDVAKTLVYRLCHWRNRQSRVIPERVITRAPSAELRPDQKDQDSLPPYDILDHIVEQFMEQDRSPADIIAQGISAENVERVTGLLKRNEYKRRQAPPGVRITRRGFGKDWRYPITSKYNALDSK